ncbi:MAG: CBS domain-containing protein [Planctomycetes bacterium]|nr:CBS domain-containing protein [Planctomycetota bacterium]
MFVRNWMSAPVISLPPGATASAALAFMEKRKIRRVPVVKDGKLVGIVTKSDLQGAGQKHAVHQVTTVANIMTPKPATVEGEDTLETAAQLMLAKKISGLPVLDGGELVGILTESDLFRALCGMLGIGERGARVTMSVKEDEDLLGQLRGRLNGLAVRSLVTLHDPGRKMWDVVMRVRGRTNRPS